MAVRPRDFARGLERSLASVYLICGDEQLLIEEACDAVLAKARSQGFTERSVLSSDTGFEWPALATAAGSLSLFSERRVLDVRMAPKQFDQTAGAAIEAHLDTPTDDVLLLMRTGRLETRQRGSKWFKRVESEGVAMVAWPIAPRELPGWVRDRCRATGIELSNDAAGYLCDSIEGNLLAAAQEIEKLALLALPQPIDLDALRASVADATHFETFDLLDAVFAGEARRIRRILYVLREEGEQPLAVLGMLVAWIRRLMTGDIQRVPPQRARLLQAARRRLSAQTLDGLLAAALDVDRRVKGTAPGDAWHGLEDLALAFGGVEVPRSNDFAPAD